MLDSLLTEKKQHLDHVFELRVSDEVLEKRITGRRMHMPSGRIYNIYYSPPKKEGLDDVTGEPLIQRADDTLETLKNRMVIYK
jgi:adenylate kinase